MSIHSRIKQKRIECGFTSHQALAKEVGVAWQTVQLREKEEGTAPSRSRINQVATVLKTTPEWLLYGITDDRRSAVPMVPREREGLTLQWVSEDEAALLSEYREKTGAGKNSLLVVARALPNVGQASDTSGAPANLGHTEKSQTND